VCAREALAQCVQRAGPDVAVHDAERENCEFCETAAARVSFDVSTDLRDLIEVVQPCLTRRLLTSESPLARTALQGRYRQTANKRTVAGTPIAL
jgi:hypothetical protein